MHRFVFTTVEGGSTGYIYIYIYQNSFIHSFTYLLTYLLICLFVYLFIYLCNIYLFIHSSTYLFLSMSMHINIASLTPPMGLRSCGLVGVGLGWLRVGLALRHIAAP